MKNKVFLLISAIVFSFSSSGQFSVKILNENFNSNMMRWQIQQNENSEMTIQDGKYSISCLKEGTAITSTIEVPNIQESNYGITATILKTKGIDDNGFGLVWGSNDANNEFEFVISGNGQFKIIQWEQGSKSELIPWTYSTAVNKWDFAKNTLKILNFNHVIKFYINDLYIAALKEKTVFGNRIGFVLNENIQIEVDNIIVENLTQKSEVNSEENAFNAEIIKYELSSFGAPNELKYNESASLNIEIKNNGSTVIKDLTLKAQVEGLIYGLEFNPITMIEKLEPYETKTISLKINANEEIPTQENNINFYIENLNHDKIDFKNLSFKTIGVNRVNPVNNENENQNTYDMPNKTTDTNNSTNTNNSTDGCSKGCTTAGFVGLIVGIIMAII